MREQGQNLGQEPFIDTLAKLVATGSLVAKGCELAGNAFSRFTEQFAYNPGRRRALAAVAGGVLVAAGLSSSLKPKEGRAQAAFPSWEPTLPNVPSCREAEISERGFTSLFVKSSADKIAVVLGGRITYEKGGVQFLPQGSTDGEDRGTAVIVIGGTPNSENVDPCVPGGVELIAYTNQKTRQGANWLGLTSYPEGHNAYDAEVEQRLWADIIRSMTDPAIGNGINGDGVNYLDYMLVDGRNGNILEMGVWAGGKLQLYYSVPRPAELVTPSGGAQPEQPQQPAQGEQTQPGFVGETQPTTSNVMGDCKPHMNPNEQCDPNGLIVAPGDTRSLVNGQWVNNFTGDPKVGSVTITENPLQFPFGGDVIATVDPEGAANAIANDMITVAGCESKCREVRFYRR